MFFDDNCLISLVCTNYVVRVHNPRGHFTRPKRAANEIPSEREKENPSDSLLLDNQTPISSRTAQIPAV